MTSIDVLSEQLEFVATVIDGIQAAARRVGFRPDDMAQIYAIALHLTIVELLAACFLLAEKQQGTGIPILLRSMYEAFVDLENLVRDASYVDHIDAANLKQFEKLVAAAKRGNPRLAGLEKRWKLVEMLDSFRAQQIALKQTGKSALRIEDKCRLAGRETEYESIYGLLCLDTHNNVSALF